jgi:thioester reductase-like protein
LRQESLAPEDEHLVTGGTGFVGAALILELLRSCRGSVVCVVRPHGDPVTARARLLEALARAAEQSLAPELGAAARTRCRVLAGDITVPLCGVDPAQVRGPVEVWHAAASLRFEDEFGPEIARHNVDGTRSAVDLARALGARCFNYISTAYVAGDARGRVFEAMREPAEPVNNVYERSKVEAEWIVARSGLRHRILRPSIVIGHSKTHAACSDTGLYGYVRRLHALRRIAERRGSVAALADAEVEGHPDAPLDLIPVDAVARNAVAISQSASLEQIFHLTNACPPTVAATARSINQVLGLPGPRICPAPHGSPYDSWLAQQMRFFRSYMQGGKRFDRAHTDAALGPEASHWPLGPDTLTRYVATYLETLKPRAGRPVGDLVP